MTFLSGLSLSHGDFLKIGARIFLIVVLYPKILREDLMHLTHYRPVMPSGNRIKNILEDLFSSVLSQLEKKIITPLET